MQRFNPETGIMEVVSGDLKILMRFDMRLLVDHAGRKPDKENDPLWEKHKVGVGTAREIIKIIAEWASWEDMEALDEYIRQNDRLFKVWREVLQKDRKWKERFPNEQC